MKVFTGLFTYKLALVALISILTGCGDGKSFTVNSVSGPGGAIAPASITVDKDKTANFTVTVENGYIIGSVSGCGGTLSGNIYTTGPITGNCTITARFESDASDPTSFTANSVSGPGGTIAPTNITVDKNKTTPFTVTAENGYIIGSVSGCGGTLSGNIYTTGPITGNCTVTALFESVASGPTSFTANSVSGAGGSIVPSSIIVDKNKTASFTVATENGYSISSVKGCGGTLSGNSYVTGPVTENCTVIALFNSNASVDPKSFIQAIADGDAAPVMVNGQAWTFRTPPPPESERTVRSGRPRLLLTPDNLPGIKEKLKDPVYDGYMNNISSKADSGKMLENAFLFQITGDIARGEAAKQALLNYSGNYGEGIIFGYDRMSDKLGPILVFDWIMDLLSVAEKEQIFANVKDNFGYDHRTANPVHRDGNGQPGVYPWYFNDVYNRHPELYLPALAFAITNEGIDDAWAEEVIAWAYDEDETRVVGPYGPNRGSGFLDALMTMSLDTGGLSETGYYNYIVEALHAVAFWESATGQAMWSRTPFLEKGPKAALTGRDILNRSSRQSSAFEYITGVFDGDTAAIAKYTLDKLGYASYMTVYRAIFGDIRVAAKTPAEINMPLAKYQRGDHTFYSKSSWDNDAVSLYVRSPYINVARYVGNEGIFAIYKGDRAIAPRVGVSKLAPDAGLYSGMWIYDPTKIDQNDDSRNRPLQNKGTYWSNSRAYDAWTTVSQSKYFEGGPKSVEVTGSYRAISMEYGQRYNSLDVGVAQRTIVHVPDGNRNFIVVYDYVDVASDLKSAWSMRLLEEPSINGSKFSLTGTMSATVVAPANHTLEWVGGFNKEFATPSPEQAWYSNSRGYAVPGYSVDRPDAINSLGLGNLYIQPAGQKNSSEGPFVQQSEYLVVIEISEAAPVSVTRISDREVVFDKWRVSFSPDGTYAVVQN